MRVCSSPVSITACPIPLQGCWLCAGYCEVHVRVLGPKSSSIAHVARRAKATGRRGRRGVAGDPPGVAKTRRFPTKHDLVQAVDRRGPDSICSFLLALLRTPELSAAVALWPKLSGPRRSMAGRRWRNGGSAARVVTGRGGCREPSPDPSRGSSGPVTTLATRAPRHPRRPSPRSSS